MFSNSLLNIIRLGKYDLNVIYNKYRKDFQSLSESNYENDLIKLYLKSEQKLSADEKDLIKQKYGKAIPHIARGYKIFQAMKYLDRFDPNYIPTAYYYPYIIKELNSPELNKYLSNKSLLDIIYQNSGISLPRTPIRTIAGVYFDSNYKQISSSEAAAILSSIDEPLLFKPSTDSSCGAGIRVIKDSERDKFIEDVRNNQIALKTHTDFVVQLFVKQSSDTAIFNPSSLNCMRITTLNLNGLVTTNSMTYKCGANNAIVDNLGSGKTGVMVGVSPDGTLASHGFYGNGDMCTEHNGITFANHRIKAFDQVVSAAIKLHSEIAVCHIIGWDIALDENNNPILIEGNTLYPGISIEQMCSGPIFGDRVDEIIDYISYSKKHY